MSQSLEICILAAGVGSRMRSNKPKVLQTLAGKPLLEHLLETASSFSPTRIHVVVGQGFEEIKAKFSDRTDINWVYQAERKGTGHAMQQAATGLDLESRVIILLGDAPLVKKVTLDELTSVDADLAVLTVDMPDPHNYGRILRQDSRVLEIIEEKDANDQQRSIKEINSGVMVADAAKLVSWLNQLTDDNAQKEFLLTDIVRYANNEGSVVKAYKTDDAVEVTGINTFTQLARLERTLQQTKALELMEQGVQLMDPERIDVRGNLTVGRGVSIDLNSIFNGEITIGDDVTIGPNCVITDSQIGTGSVIKANSVLEQTIVGNHCSVGPFARLRPGSELADQVAVGNFVEIKKSKLGKGSKASHLTYLGDSSIGAGVNIGAGTITCNYDGENKYQTHIGEGAFIGSNSSLVAPLNIGAGATIGAGSTITKDVDDNALVLGRGKQKSIANWQRPTNKK
jgi:bifunctional UDP-N-acetylglucosamine pyrophosphorylase/glucosamine-1-phosphate N-acetyltransferase